MITMKNVLSAANEQVADLMRKGYMISFMNASMGYAFRVDLENDRLFSETNLRVKVERVGGYGEADKIVLSVIEIPEADGFEDKDAAVLYSKTWYIVSYLESRRLQNSLGRYQRDYVLVESKDESDAIIEKQRERYRNSGETYCKAKLTVTPALIRALKARGGFSNATRNNVLVSRVERGYEVSLKARDGHISRTELIRFPKH